MKYIFPVFIVFTAFLLFSCKKDSFITSPNASLQITADSVKFDTVFTSVGSVTKSFKIINENDQKILLNKVKLMGGAASAFNININGSPATALNNLEIAANDSIYVFVSVTIDPSAANLPFIISDSILISYNSKDLYVQLQAFGQNAHFLRNHIITNDTTWTADLPYVILGNLRIDTLASLTMEAGCKIYAHADARVIVDGTLIITGEKDNEVQFSGDRLDPGYKDLPASWPGIYFRGSSKNNVLTFSKIKNANRAIEVHDPSVNTNPKLVMHQCIIDNAFEAGLISLNSSVQADNTLISNCGNNINIQLGGEYNFTNCTIAAYSNVYFLHTNPVMAANNFTIQNGATITADLNAMFSNCIFWGDYGNVDDEVVIDKQGTNIFNVTLENCLYKAINAPLNTTLTSVITNLDPSFDSIDVGNKYFDFRITKNDFAPGINSGKIVVQQKDLDNNPRSIGLPDLGSYEKQ